MAPRDPWTSASSYLLLPLGVRPEAWGTGSVEGLRARGGFEVSIRWANHTLEEAVIRSKTGHACVIRYDGQTVKADMPKGTRRVLHSTDFYNNL